MLIRNSGTWQPAVSMSLITYIYHILTSGERGNVGKKKSEKCPSRSTILWLFFIVLDVICSDYEKQ